MTVVKSFVRYLERVRVAIIGINQASFVYQIFNHSVDFFGELRIVQASIDVIVKAEAGCIIQKTDNAFFSVRERDQRF